MVRPQSLQALDRRGCRTAGHSEILEKPKNMHIARKISRHTQSFCSGRNCCIILPGVGGTKPIVVSRLQNNAPPGESLGPPSQSDHAIIRVVHKQNSSTSLHHSPPKTIYETLKERNCLPSQGCRYCLSSPEPAGTCASCWQNCSCYCESLCSSLPEATSMPVTAELHVVPPQHLKGIPKIVHQTYFEKITPEKYPHWRRFVESFKRLDGWEYRFYMDDDARSFIVQHFPPEVVQAYDALIPGAFKADLFRYCVLLIHGGLYADIDVLLEAPNLDEILGDQVTFVAPTDLPGLRPEEPVCLWNGFLAAAPGHAFLVETIQKIVNGIRNRHTTMDYVDPMYCPDPPLRLIFHSLQLLSTTGPCVLDSMVNQALGNDLQTPFVPGQLEDPVIGKVLILDHADSPVRGYYFFHPDVPHQIVASTNHPGAETTPSKGHYGEALPFQQGFIYGVRGVYKDMLPSRGERAKSSALAKARDQYNTCLLADIKQFLLEED